MSSLPATFVLPDLLSLCTFEGDTNPHYIEASTKSAEWILSFNVFSDERRSVIHRSGAGLLCAHVYCYTGYEALRTCCDFTNLLFTIDETSDLQNAHDASRTGGVFLEALRNPKFDDGSVLCKITKQFRLRLAKMGPASYRRFLDHCEDYIEAVGKEAYYRERDIVLDLKSYQVLRRENSAVRTCVALIPLCFGIDLPDEVAKHETLMRMHLAAVDMVCWSNDLYSYNMEQSLGLFANNVLSVLMKHNKLDLQGAADYVGVQFKLLMERFVEDKACLPSWGAEMDAKVAKFVKGLECWVIGNLNWSFETPRYFGAQRESVQATRVVRLDPKRV